MTPELQLHYENLMELFGSAGWKEFIEDLAIMATPLENIRECEDLKFRQGQLDVVDWLRTYEESNRQAYEDLAKE